MRIAVFTSQFPGRINTFFARDVRSLIDDGMDVDVFPLYPLDAGCWPSVPACLNEQVLPRTKVHHLGSWATASGAVRTAGRTPAVGDLARTGASALRFGAGPVAKTACAVAKACAWARQAQAPFDHVLAYWGNYSATAAYVFQRLTAERAVLDVSHAGTDLYRDQVFLREKLVYADNVVLVCDFNRSFLEHWYPDLFPDLERKLRIHHLPLDLDEYQFVGGRGRDGEHGPGEPDDPIVAAVGSLEAVKGYDSLVRAAGRLASSGRRFRLTLVGDGPERPALEALASELGIEGRVTFAGWQPPDAARRVIRGATLLAHPSAGLGDAVPTVIKEALALGTPVVASRVAGIPELLDEGRCGVLVPPRDVESLANAIERLLAQPELRQLYARAGRAYAEMMFDARRNGPRLASILRATRRLPALLADAQRPVRTSAAS